MPAPASSRREGRRRLCSHSLLLAALCLFGTTAHATDSWTNVATGVDYLHRVESGSLPQDIHVAKVDLTNPLVSIHASNDLSTERGGARALRSLSS